MIFNLDSTFQPLGENQVTFKSFTFSGGEPHIKISSDLTNVEKVTITTRVTSFNDMGLLLCAVDAIKRCGVKMIDLFIPYFPGARQDRVMISGEPLTVKVYADLLNSLNLNEITVFDPHSEVTPAVLNDCKVVTNYKFIEKVIEKIGSEVLLISPDGGALKKIYKVSEYLGGVAVVECSKKRNVTNGKLEGFKVYEEDLGGENCLIVDDICDGGGTFMGLADELKKKNAGDLYLAVSHGIFSKGIEHLREKFTKVFTTDSFKDVEDVQQIKLETLM
ncbi:ribose-phosphate diphosphokinase [Tenacibaculum jejuense]|uniref:Phosphoribosylpyrophosphate synthetase n=1 Tax=Tenacibaculum jejuense TaxID=584609 RepID=A0A238UCL7_9FLAO|nr:ribose-phosphate diphosphokinase [Tenacibaculum jejuense]SNR16150.1 Phosphoribosylpyrophosphate synthetase [Tenacibaculum jejuense]